MGEILGESVDLGESVEVPTLSWPAMESDILGALVPQSVLIAVLRLVPGELVGDAAAALPTSSFCLVGGPKLRRTSATESVAVSLICSTGLRCSRALRLDDQTVLGGMISSHEWIRWVQEGGDGGEDPRSIS